jgi:hypothetical protein
MVGVIGAWLLVGCLKGASDKGDVEPDTDPGVPDAPSTAIGLEEVSVSLDLGRDGCAASGGEAGTAATLVVRDGTCLRTAIGQRLTGSWRVVLMPQTPGEQDRAAFRVAAVSDPEGVEVDVRIDPPAEVWVTVDDRAGWELWSEFKTHAMPSRQLTRDHTAAPSFQYPDGTWGAQPADGGFLYDPARAVWVVLSDGSRVHRFRDKGYGRGGEVEGDVVHTLELPGEGEWPRLCKVDLIGEDASWLGGILDNPGLTVGDPEVATPGGLYAVSVVEEGGRRLLRVRTKFHNEIKLRGWLYQQSGDPTPFEGVADGGSPDEEEPGPYDGIVEIWLRGWGGFDEWARMAADTLDVDAPAGANHEGWAETSFLEHGDGTYSAEYRGVWDVSVRELADRLPEDWEVEVRDRLLVVTQPCPAPPRGVVTTWPGNEIVLFNPLTLEEERRFPAPGTPGDIVIDPGGSTIGMVVPEGFTLCLPTLGGDDTLYCSEAWSEEPPLIDLPSTPVAATDWYDAWLTAHPDGKVVTTPRDQWDVQVNWDAVAALELSSGPMINPHDGSDVFVVNTIENSLIRLDMVRGTSTVMPVQGGQNAAPSPDGELVAVTDYAGASVHIYNHDGTLLRSHAVGAGAFDVTWSADGRYLIGSAYQADRVRVWDGSRVTEAAPPYADIVVDGPWRVSTATDGLDTMLVVGSYDGHALVGIPLRGAVWEGTPPVPTETLDLGGAPELLRIAGDRR